MNPISLFMPCKTKKGANTNDGTVQLFCNVSFKNAIIAVPLKLKCSLDFEDICPSEWLAAHLVIFSLYLCHSLSLSVSLSVSVSRCH